MWRWPHALPSPSTFSCVPCLLLFLPYAFFLNGHPRRTRPSPSLSMFSAFSSPLLLPPSPPTFLLALLARLSTLLGVVYIALPRTLPPFLFFLVLLCEHTGQHRRLSCAAEMCRCADEHPSRHRHRQTCVWAQGVGEGREGGRNRSKEWRSPRMGDAAALLLAGRRRDEARLHDSRHHLLSHTQSHTGRTSHTHSRAEDRDTQLEHHATKKS